MRLRCEDRDRHSAVIGCSGANVWKRDTGRSARARRLALRQKVAVAFHLSAIRSFSRANVER